LTPSSRAEVTRALQVTQVTAASAQSSRLHQVMRVTKSQATRPAPKLVRAFAPHPPRGLHLVRQVTKSQARGRCCAVDEVTVDAAALERALRFAGPEGEQHVDPRRRRAARTW
jgi:hypothetical protein